MRQEALLASARSARLRAYAPYSKFLVGAALLTEEGAIITGGNIENSSYGMTVCAERVAVWTATHAGYRRFPSIAVVTDSSPPSAPCGACRQVLWELAGDIEVIMGNLNGDKMVMSLLELMARPFGSAIWSENPVSDAMLDREEMWRVPVSFHPVGYVISEYEKPGSIPDDYKERLARVIIAPEMEEGLYGLDQEDKINVISYLHQASGYTLKDNRQGRGNEIYGVFACRAPLRPNALAQTVVELVAIEKNVLTVRGLDLINGTPVLDIKTVLTQ